MFVAHMYVAKRDLESELPRELRLKRFPPSARFTVRKSPATRTSNGRLGVSGVSAGRRFAILTGHLRAFATTHFWFLAAFVPGKTESHAKSSMKLISFLF